MRICMASDFFYPNTGGVEAHVWQLSDHLISLGHTVIVITHAYGKRVGIRYLKNNLKVYYLPLSLYPKQNIIWPLIFNTFTCARQILIKEKIDLVHGHSAFSPLAHQTMFHAKTLGLNTVFTDHSLFGFDDIGAIIHNQVVKLSLLQCNHIICVSHVGKENKALNLEIGKNEFIPITVIPNAVDTSMFTPDPSKRDPNKITIIVNSRLVYRKGIDLLASVIPKICQIDPRIQFIIAGDGPKRDLLDAAVKQYNLSERVTLLGFIPHDQVRNILVKGDIFLNTSLIEAFCMAIVEAASCGLLVVSTNVGGLPQVLPRELIKLTEPTAEALLDGVRLALKDISTKNFVPPIEAHKMIFKNYSWRDVARQTDNVYKAVSKEPEQHLKSRIGRYYNSDSVFKLIFIPLLIIDYLLLIFNNWYNPHDKVNSTHMYPKKHESFRANQQVIASSL